MNQKVQSFAELVTTTTKQLTGSYTEWTTFLSTVGRLYKYPYSEQVLIYAQRPDATACASFDVWNHRMNRAVRRGSKGIALMDTSSGEPRLRYVFDISDTVGRDKSRRPFLWQYRDEHSEVVTANLAEHFDMPNENDLPYLLDMTADDLAAAYWDDHREDILASVPDSYLEDLDEFNIEVAFRNAAGASTAYVLLSRCGLNPEDYFSHEDFMSVFDFNTPDAATALGTAVSENSEQVLRQIEVTIKNFERARRAERGMEHGEQTELPAGRGLPAARIDLGELPASGQVRTDEGAVSEGEPPGAVQPPAPEWETAAAFVGDRPDSEPAIGGADAADSEVHGDNRADKSVRPDEMGGADEQLQGQSGEDDRERIDLQLEPETPAPAIDFGAVGPTGVKFSHRERTLSTIPFYSSTAEKEQIVRNSDALKNSRGEVAAFFSDNANTGKRVDFIKGFFNNTYTEMILDNRQRAGYVAYDDALHLWRGAYLSRDQEEYLSWDAVADMISGMMERGQWMDQTVLGVDESTAEQITIQIDEPAPPEVDYIPNLFDIAGSIPLTNEPTGEPITIKPQVSQEVIDAALTLGANERDSRLRIIAEFMKDKPLEENARFLQAHYKENGAGFYVGERKYSLWYDDAGLRIAPGESAMSYTAAALDWEQAAVRIRELLNEGKYASQSMLYHAWPYERKRVADVLLLLFRDIDSEYRKEKMLRLEGIQNLRVGYPDMLAHVVEKMQQSDELQIFIDEYATFMKDYAHNRKLLLFRHRGVDEILQGLEDLRRIPLRFDASPDYTPVERFFISQDEIDRLLREEPDHHEYRIGVVNFFESHPDKKEREKYLGHLHGEYSGHGGGNDNVLYSPKQLDFRHGIITDPYAAIKLKWPQVRKRIEELIAHDAFLSAEDREIMKSRTLEPEVESATPLDRAKEIINDFCQSEFESDADFSDLSRVELGYTTTEDGEHPIQFYADLVAYRIVYEVDGQSVFSLQCHDLDDLNGYLGNLEFDEMAALAEKEYTKQAQSKDSPASIFEPIPENPFREVSADTERDAQTNRIRDTLIANTKAHFASYQAIKDAHPKDIVLFQRGDFYEMYGPDARAASVELDIHLTNYNIPELGRVAICGVPAHALDQSMEKLRKKYGVTVSPVPERGAERTAYSLPVLESVAGNTEPTTRRYLVTTYHSIENGFDDKLDYQTQQEAEEVAHRYVDGSMDEDGFQYEGAAVFDLQERQWVYVAGQFPVLDGVELPHLPYKVDQEPTQAQSPTVRELYEHYKEILMKKVMEDEAFRNACLRSDRQNAIFEGGEAVDRAAKNLGITQGDMRFYQLYFANTSFHQRLKEELANEGYDSLIAAAREIPPKPTVDTPVAHDPLAPAYKVGDTVYLDNTAFTITEVGLHDVQLQDPTLTYPILRSEDKENFEKLLHRNPQNLPITDYLPYTAIGPIDDGDDLRDALTGDGGLLDAGAREEVSEWLRNGEGNSTIANLLQEQFNGYSDTMTLETGETADYSVTGNTLMLNLLDKSHTVRMYDLRTVAGVLRAMYQQELGGFSHESTKAPPVQPAYTAKTEVVYPAEKNHLPFDVVVQTLHFDEPERNTPQNFRITDDNLGAGGAKAKYRMNMDALNTLHKIEEENRPATPDEQAVLSKYVGWGALADAFDESKPAWANEYKELKEILTPEEYDSARASTLNAHYTSPVVIKAIYQALENMGFKGGNILEPSCGVGNFFGLLPESMSASKLYGVELDGLTGRIAKQLYPKAHIEIKGYESANFQKNSFDVAIGNVPFGNYKVNDPAYNKLGFSIHNFFFAKAIDQVRPGGILAFVTSRYTMDSKSTQAREYISQRAELLGAIRLPENAFLANAGTEVVTDILFLQKREQPITQVDDWVYTEENKDGFAINSYFIGHPGMVLGDETITSTAHGPDYTVAARPSADLGELLNTAITHIDGQYIEVETLAVEDEKEEVTIPADPRVKNFSYTIIKGDVYYRQDSIMVKMELGATAKARVTALIDLRDCAQRLIAEQLDGFSSNEAIRVAQQNLNWLYDNFSAKFGLINDKMNERAFSQDSSYYLLCALEILDDDGKFVRKADMFTKRTIMPHQVIEHVDTAAEALAISIGERARVDLPFMAGLTGKTEDEIINDLHGQIYAVPFHGQDGRPIYQTADEYLSGNVRQKLTVAQAAAASNPTYEINVDALTAALPRDLDASEIQVRLGATWIEPEYVDQFMRELLKPPIHTRKDVQVRYSPKVNVWNISNKSMIPKNDVMAYTTYGTSRVSAYALLEDALNLQDTKVYDLVEDVDGRDKRVLNAKETTLAQQKQSMIKLAFQDWIFRDPDRRQTLVRKYNDEMNCIRPREYDGSHLVLAGMNPEIQLEEHQKNAVARAVYGGNTLFAHCVGAGKTFEITASAMEMKRLGLCSKSMIVVPNHLTQQWASEFLRLYPNANILVTTKRDFEKNRRKKFCSRIATGDYDAVIIGYSQFEKIPISKKRQINLLDQQIEDITDGIKRAKAEAGEHYTVKYMERTKKSLEARLEKLQGDNRKDDVVNFEDLGIDRLFVDESDGFKNLFLYTKMRNVAGLSTSEAQKSTDLFNKTQYLDEITDYKGTIFATGTPISNSITEMYTVQRYLQYNVLKGMGIGHFDSWASRFGETTTTMELAPEGTGYRPRTRFAKFFNLPELMNIFHEVADIKTPDMLNLPTPEVEYHNEVAKPTEYQQEYVQQLSERATAVRKGAVDSSKDNMLVITNDGRKLGLDQRLIDPLSGDAPDSKLNKCVENILKIWQDGTKDRLTQLVFCDNSVPKKDGSFNVYDDIKSKLVAQGVPESEVAFIHDADTEVKKKELFGKVRSGTVRVLIGSTQKMGAGTNAQDRLIALHHLDCPWRPRDLTQREGRIIRRGNMNPLVHIYRYVTEATFDAYLWQTVEKKQQFIGQIMTSKSPVRSCEDVDEAALSYAEVKALCAGDPRIKERMELDVDIAKLQMIQANYRSQQYELEDKIRLYFPQEQQRLEWRIEGIQRDINTLAQYPLSEDEYVGIELCGKHFDERKPAGAVLLEECKNVKAYTSAPVGKYRGLELFVKKTNLLSETQIIIKGAVEYAFTASDSDIGNITRLDNALERLPEELEKSKANLENVKQQFESAKAEVGKPFPQEDELKIKLARITELDIALKMKDDVPDKESVQVSSREDDAIDL